MLSDELPDSFEADRALLQRVKLSLHQRGYASHRSLEISAERSVVVVQGRLPTFYLRQIAVECIKRVAGVTHVIDLIAVGDDPRQPQDHADHQPEFPVIATRDCVDLPDLTRAAHVVHRPQLRQRNRLSSVKG